MQKFIEGIDERLVRGTFLAENVNYYDYASLKAARLAYWRYGAQSSKPVRDMLIEADLALHFPLPPLTSVTLQETFLNLGSAPDQPHPPSEEYRVASVDLSRRATTLALAWFFSGEQAMADEAVSVIRQWMHDRLTELQMLPDAPEECVYQASEEYTGHALRSTQSEGSFPVLCSNRWASSSIRETGFYFFLDAVRLLRKHISKQDMMLMKYLLANYQAWLLHGRDARLWANGQTVGQHETLWDLEVVAISAFIDDARTMQRVLQRAPMRLDRQFNRRAHISSPDTASMLFTSSYLFGWTLADPSVDRHANVHSTLE